MTGAGSSPASRIDSPPKALADHQFGRRGFLKTRRNGMFSLFSSWMERRAKKTLWLDVYKTCIRNDDAPEVAWKKSQMAVKHYEGRNRDQD